MERKIRNSAKALITKDEKMLASKINDNDDIFYYTTCLFNPHVSKII